MQDRNLSSALSSGSYHKVKYKRMRVLRSGMLIVHNLLCRYRERTYVNTRCRHYARRFVIAPIFSISMGAAFLNGRGSDHAISIPVFQNTRKSNFALCDYTRAHSTPLRSFAIMHAFTSGSLFTQYLESACLYALHFVFNFYTYSDNEMNITQHLQMARFTIQSEWLQPVNADVSWHFDETSAIII